MHSTGCGRASSGDRRPTLRLVTTFLTRELRGSDGYKLLTGLVVPRPIGWVGSRSSDGVNNLAPYSFFNAVSGDPPMVVVAPGNSGRKDTRDNIVASGVFTLNVVSMELAASMNLSAATVDADISEFDTTGLTAVDGGLVDAPRVSECLATMECVMTEAVPIGRDGGGNLLIIADVVAFHVDDELLDGTRIDQQRLAAVGRHAGNWYSDATHLFELPRPD